MSEKQPTFAGEVQFAAFTDSSRGGPRVTLRLADRDELAKFVGCEGKRYMAVLVEIADDETPAEPAAPRSYADSYVDLQNPGRSPDDVRREVQQRERRQRMAPLCEWAVLRCAESDFQQWCIDAAQRDGVAREIYLAYAQRNDREGWAKATILRLCGLDPINGSRKDLDTNPAAAKRFHERVRAPYAAWLAQQKVPA